jgi:ATP-dependent Lhr-like helicase
MLVRYVKAQRDAVGVVPTREDLLIERFFDEAGGLQLVIHSPYGARINRGFGLALRKRLCRSFNMELQAAATDDAIVLSLGTPQSFPLDSVPRFVRADHAEELLTQAFLYSPMFTARWRWNATRSLAVLRSRSGRPVPFPLQRMQADDLLGSVFPDQVACQENVAGPIEIPEHPLIAQTVHDCLHEASDVDRLVDLLRRMEKGEVRVHTRETVEPSPFSHEILNARPYAFLDDAPLEERRTRAVAMRHALPDDARDLARLDPDAVARVRDEAAPDIRTPDELHEVLYDWVVSRPSDLGAAFEHFETLEQDGRAFRVGCPDDVERVAVEERREEVSVLFPKGAEAAADSAVRGHLGSLGPVLPRTLAERTGISLPGVEASLARLEARGVALRGEFDPALDGEQVCDRALLSRVHRYTIARLRQEIRPVSAADLLRFLVRWQRVHPEEHAVGEEGLFGVVEQLSAFEAAAGAWEGDLLPARVEGYRPELLDRLCLSGRVAWGRLVPPVLAPGARPSRVTPTSLFPREEMEGLLHAAADDAPERAEVRAPARRILELLESRGALFLPEIISATGLLAVQVEEGLLELVAVGRVSADGWASLRRLLRRRPSTLRPRRGTRTRRSGGIAGPEGRWGCLRPLGETFDRDALAEETAWRLLRRYGVVFRDLVSREWLPGGWRTVHHALRRLEARGQVRGGRFVSGFFGEQFALPDAITPLRRARDSAGAPLELRVSSCDALNLAGILTPGARVPASPGRRLVLRDGIPVAVVERGRTTSLEVSVFDARQA